MRARTPSRSDLESIHDYGVDVAERRVFLIGDVCAESASRTIGNLRYLDRRPGPVSLVLASDGGSVTYGWAVYDALLSMGSRVTVDGFGAVHSIAALILQGGSVRRLAANSRMLIHFGSMDLGTVHASELESLGREQANDNRAYSAALARRSILTPETVLTMCAKETCLGAKEALRMGFIDAVVPTREL